MSTQAVNQSADRLESGLQNLDSWALPISEEIENYPNYWHLKGWKCFVAP